jgi:hypothetical protein
MLGAHRLNTTLPGVRFDPDGALHASKPGPCQAKPADSLLAKQYAFRWAELACATEDYEAAEAVRVLAWPCRQLTLP